MSNVPRALLATASASPAGDQAIASIRAPSRVNWRSGDPSGDQSQTSSTPVLADTYATWSLTGDRIGMNVARCPTPPSPTLSRDSGPAPAGALQSSGVPPRDDTNTTRLPSVDQWGGSAPPTERIANN